jgi:membrane protease YdiL (CAAX protease family)
MDPSSKLAADSKNTLAVWQNTLLCGSAVGYLFSPTLGLTCAVANGIFSLYTTTEPWFPPLDEKVFTQIKEIWDQNHLFKLQLIIGVVLRALNVSINQVGIVWAKSAIGSPINMLIVFSRICIVAPLLEEPIFRGFFQDRIKDIQVYLFGEKEACSELQKIIRIFAQAIVFGLCHYNPKQGASNRAIVVGTSAAGVYFGSVKEETKNLWTSSFFHGYVNASVLARVYLFGV